MKYSMIVLLAGVLACSLVSSAQAEVRTYETANGTFRVVSNMGGYIKQPGDKPAPEDVRTASGGMIKIRCDMIRDPAGNWHRGFPDNLGSIHFFYDHKVSEGTYQTFIIASYGVWRWYAGEGFVEVFKCPGHNYLLGRGMLLRDERLQDGYFLTYRNSSGGFGGVVIHDPTKTGKDAWRLIRYKNPDSPSGLKKVKEEDGKITMSFDEGGGGPNTTVVFDKTTEAFTTARQELKEKE